MERIAEVARVARGRYWREADARMVVDAWERSGTSRAEFARSHRIDQRRLARWIRRLNGAEQGADFHPVQVLRSGTQASTHGEAAIFEIQLASGDCLRVPSSFQAADLRRVLAILGETARC